MKRNSIKLLQNKFFPPVETEIEVLYEDNHLIAINKKPSQIVQGDKTGDISLDRLVRDYIKKRYNKPGEVYLGVVHRLDRPVSGVVVFARTSKALSRLNELFREREVEKSYWAIVKESPPMEKGVLENFLKKNESQNKSYISQNADSGAKAARLEYSIINRSDNYFLLEVRPLTGRHHQIRCQLANAGCPIKGDLKYGFPRSNKDKSISLHARHISFIHPVKKERLDLIAPIPNDNLWKALTEQRD